MEDGNVVASQQDFLVDSSIADERALMTDFLIDDEEEEEVVEEEEISNEEPPAFNDENQPPSESLMSMMLDSTPRPGRSVGTNFSCKLNERKFFTQYF